MEQMTIGKRIMTLRKEQGLTQEQLAEKVGVSAQAVSKWENDASCPDISVIPIVARELGVTTDELLGVKPIEPKVVVVDSGSHGGEKKKESHGISDEGKKGGIWFAVIVIVLGISFLMKQFGILSISVWGIVWPSVILGCGVAWSVSSLSPIALGIAGLGFYYLLFNLHATDYVLTWGVIWPILLILLGLTILMDRVWPNRGKWKNFHGDHPATSEYSETDGYIRYDCSFSEENRRVSSEHFAGANIDISFGKSALDLTQVKSVAPGAKIDADVSFGSFELYLPRTIRLSVESDKAFGNIQVKGDAAPDATDQLFLRGDVSFGSMTVQYL